MNEKGSDNHQAGSRKRRRKRRPDREGDAEAKIPWAEKIEKVTVSGNV